MLKYILPLLLITLVAVSGIFFFASLKPTGKQIAVIGEPADAQDEIIEEQPQQEESTIEETPAEEALIKGVPEKTAEPEKPSERVLAYWPFDAEADPETLQIAGSIEGNSVKDVSGNNNHGFLQDGLDPTSPDGAHQKISGDSIAGKSLLFDGKDDSVAVPYKKSLDSENAITVSAWVNLRTREGQPFKTILQKPSSTEDVPVIYSLNLDSKNKNLVFSISANEKGTFAYAVSKTEIPVNEWTHATGSWDGNKLKLFVNGELVDEKDTEGIISQIGINKKPVYIGSSETAGASNFDGKIDEVQIANYAFPEEQILQAYEQYRPPGQEPEKPAYEPIGLLAKLSMNNLGDGLADQAENGHDGIPEGPVDETEGISGNALHFENSYANLPLSETIKAAPEISVSLWVKLDPAHQGGTLFEARPEKESGVPAGLSLKISPSGEPALSKGSSPGEETTVTGQSITSGEWHHLVGIFDGKELKLYADAILAEPSKDPKKIDWANDLPAENTIPAHFSIAAAGIRPDGSFGNFLKASVDEVQIYDATLSQKNVEYLYNNPGEAIG